MSVNKPINNTGLLATLLIYLCFPKSLSLFDWISANVDLCDNSLGKSVDSLLLHPLNVYFLLTQFGVLGTQCVHCFLKFLSRFDLILLCFVPVLAFRLERPPLAACFLYIGNQFLKFRTLFIGSNIILAAINLSQSRVSSSNRVLPQCFGVSLKNIVNHVVQGSNSLGFVDLAQQSLLCNSRLRLALEQCVDVCLQVLLLFLQLLLLICLLLLQPLP